MTRGQRIEAHLGDFGSSQLKARAAGAQGCWSEQSIAAHAALWHLGAVPLPSPRCTSVQPVCSQAPGFLGGENCLSQSAFKRRTLKTEQFKSPHKASQKDSFAVPGVSAAGRGGRLPGRVSAAGVVPRVLWVPCVAPRHGGDIGGPVSHEPANSSWCKAAARAGRSILGSETLSQEPLPFPPGESSVVSLALLSPHRARIYWACPTSAVTQ